MQTQAIIMTRELLDCYRRDISSRHPVFYNRAIDSLRDYIERGGQFDCEATRLSALSLYSSLSRNH